MALTSDMIPTEIFIEAVRKQPCIYDKDDTNFRNQTARGQAWIDIVTDVGGDLSSDNIDLMKMRWRSLKDCYLKHKRAINPLLSTHLNKQYKNWRWAKYFTFLDPLITTKNSKLTLLMKKKSAKQKCITQNLKQKERTIKKEFLDEHEVQSNEKFSEVYVNMHEPENRKRDDIYHLFSSYIETFRKFSPKRQVMLKMDLANLFLKAEMEHIDELMSGNNNMVNGQGDCFEQITGFDPESE